jgi:dipeptidyl aminopeptidase/acylaminoacyl peptidase
MTRIAPRRHVYRRDGDASLLLDVYLPPNASATARTPVVFLVHGGPILPAMPPPRLSTGRSTASFGRH